MKRLWLSGTVKSYRCTHACDRLNLAGSFASTSNWENRIQEKELEGDEMPDFARGYRHQLVAVICAILIVPGEPSAARPVLALQQSGGSEEQAPKIPNDQLDSLVAPIALYPDPLLAQVLAASTYPLEIMQLQQWLTKHKDLKDKA